MLSKNTLKFIKSLQIKKFRDEEGLFIVEGLKSVVELLNSKFEIQGVYCTPDFEKYLKPFAIVKSKISIITQSELESISRLTSNDSMLAVAKMDKNSIIAFKNIESALLLNQIQDPGNLGTIIRTADWFGIKTIICDEATVDFYNPKVISATMGSFTRVNIHYTDLENSIVSLKSNDFTIYGALLNGLKMSEITKTSKYALVIGNESNGITDSIQKLIDKSISIEGFGDAESLNAAVAAGIIMHHLSRLT
ncbi:MAG: TrmH family RNA methyltransferase [Cytophagales bacterium]